MAFRYLCGLVLDDRLTLQFDFYSIRGSGQWVIVLKIRGGRQQSNAMWIGCFGQTLSHSTPKVSLFAWSSSKYLRCQQPIGMASGHSIILPGREVRADGVLAFLSQDLLNQAGVGDIDCENGPKAGFPYGAIFCFAFHLGKKQKAIAYGAL